MSDKINEMPDGFYYFCELRIPKSANFNIEAIANEFVNNCPEGFAPFWKLTSPEDDYYCIELWKIVGDWLSPAVANTLSLWQIEDICAERNLAYVPRKENESSLWKRWGDNKMDEIKYVTQQEVNIDKYEYAVCSYTPIGIDYGIQVPRKEYNDFVEFSCPRCGRKLGLFVRGTNFINGEDRC